MESKPADQYTIRIGLRPGDLGWIVHRHAILYHAEHGFDEAFEAYVARTMAEMVERRCPANRIWIAERPNADAVNGRQIVGSIAIVQMSPRQAQLRWFYVEPAARGRGLGTQLIKNGISHCRDCGFDSVVLWTADVLKAAARLYVAAGFRKVQIQPGRSHGVELVEEKYELRL